MTRGSRRGEAELGETESSTRTGDRTGPSNERTAATSIEDARVVHNRVETVVLVTQFGSLAQFAHHIVIVRRSYIVMSQ